MKYFAIYHGAMPFDKNPLPVRPEVPRPIQELHESVFGRPAEEITLHDRPDMPEAIREFARANGVRIT